MLERNYCPSPIIVETINFNSIECCSLIVFFGWIYEFVQTNGKVIEKKSSRRANGGNEGGRKIFFVCNFLYRDFFPLSSPRMLILWARNAIFLGFHQHSTISRLLLIFLIHWSSFFIECSRWLELDVIDSLFPGFIHYIHCL